MDPVTIAAIIGGLPATIAALAAFIVGWRNSAKADSIHVLVNSNLTAVKADLAMALQRVDSLTALVTSLTGAIPQPPAGTVDPYAAQRALRPDQKASEMDKGKPYKPGL